MKQRVERKNPLWGDGLKEDSPQRTTPPETRCWDLAGAGAQVPPSSAASADTPP